jgi:hypothetical protein
MKMDLNAVGCEGMDWTGVAEDRDRRCTVVNEVMILRFHKMRGIS